MSLFRTPEKPGSVTFMLRGGPDVDLLRFALGLAPRGRKAKPLAVIGTDRSPNFYAGDKTIGSFVLVEAKTLAEIEASIAEVRRRKRSFSGVVINSVTDWWNAQLEAHEVVTKDGGRVVPPRAWRVLREEREQQIRALQSLPFPVVLICEERPVFERTEAELREVGTREDTDKKEAYLSDVRLRLFSRAGTECAEVLKDRTGRFPMGAIVEKPAISMWLPPSVVELVQAQIERTQKGASA